MQVSKTTKILVIVLSIILLTTGIVLVLSKNKTQDDSKVTTKEPVDTNQGQPNTDTQENQDNTTNEETNDQATNPEPNQPTQELTDLDTSNWKTYTNEEYGFSFKYPGEWEITTTSNDLIIENSQFDNKLSIGLISKKNDSRSSILNFIIYNNKESLGLLEWTRKYLYKPDAELRGNARLEEYLLETQPEITGLNLIYPDCGACSSGILFKNRGYVIEYVYAQDPFVLEDYYPTLKDAVSQGEFIYDNILLTLKLF